MKNILLFYCLFMSFFQLAAQEPLKPIVIINNHKFYYEDQRVQPNKDLEAILKKARNAEVDNLFRRGKDVTSLGKVIEIVGLGLLTVNLFQTLKRGSEKRYSLSIAGASTMLVGVIVEGAGFRKKREAVKKYNVLIGPR